MESKPVRGTQSVVEQMGWVFTRPSLTGLEIAWRWLFGLPFLAVLWFQAQAILAELPPETTGLTSLDPQNPWISAVKLAVAWDMYRPHVVSVLKWLLPLSGVAWSIFSAVGRNLVLKRMDSRLPLRLVPMMVLQAAWLVLLGLTGWAWFRSIGWAAATHIGNGADPDLVGYAVWVIFLSLGFFAAWALISWAVTIAPMLVLLENIGSAKALVESLCLGRAFTSKLVEINLVMGIVKVALLVVAMVFSAVLIPFSNEVGASALHLEWIIVSVGYFVASDYFHVVRLKGFVEFWSLFRGST